MTDESKTQEVQEDKPEVVCWAVFSRDLCKLPLRAPYPKKGIVVNEGSAYAVCQVVHGPMNKHHEQMATVVSVPWHNVLYMYYVAVEEEDKGKGGEAATVEAGASGAGTEAAGGDTSNAGEATSKPVPRTAGAGRGRRKGNRSPSRKTRR